jgi:nitroimidazol reductase NimA-like FMN-containing flavoprotein (pyridoxamine 5'-phosphate oxidase superfamily)
MIEVEEMDDSEIDDLLVKVGYGHLGCARNDVPYVVPIHYACIPPYIYIYTTEGKKFEIISENARVCLQVEKIYNNRRWKSVIVNGTAEIVVDPRERERALKAVLETNPTLTPALSVRWMDNWIKENIEVIYRIEPASKTGRRSKHSKTRLFAKFGKRPLPEIH